MTDERKPFDSSRTRVAPIFGAIAQHDDWIRRLLELPHHGYESRRPVTGDLTMLPGASFWWPEERGLRPPVSLLSWLIRHFRGPVSGKGPTADARRRLAEGDATTVEAALLALRMASDDHGWWILEGRTYPDAMIATPDLLLVVEGKRTERARTTQVSWMPQRHQIWRDLDAVWEIRGRREVVGILIVEGEDSGNVPQRWIEAARVAVGQASLEGSFPHRSPVEQQAIAQSFWGVTTWQIVAREFGIDLKTLAVARA